MTPREIERVAKAAFAFLERRRPPVELRNELDLSFRFENQRLEIFEIRPRWRHPNELEEHPVAKARYLNSRREWHIYWMRADFKWHRYEPVATVATVEQFLNVVDEDKYGCFFG
jgi:hypothetical protein